MKTRIFLIIIACFLLGQESSAQSSKRLLKTFIPYQWEIYNTIYKRRYWDWRDNYDYIAFKKDKTFKRRYEGINTSGTWTYNRKKKVVKLTVTHPTQKTVTLKVKKLSRKEFLYTSSEEGHKVKMFMKEGEVPTRKKRKKSSKRVKKPKKKN